MVASYEYSLTEGDRLTEVVRRRHRRQGIWDAADADGLPGGGACAEQVAEVVPHSWLVIGDTAYP